MACHALALPVPAFLALSRRAACAFRRAHAPSSTAAALSAAPWVPTRLVAAFSAVAASWSPALSRCFVSAAAAPHVGSLEADVAQHLDSAEGMLVA